MKLLLIISALSIVMLQIASAQSFPEIPQHCFDNSKNFNELGLNCGGDCLPCGVEDIDVEVIDTSLQSEEQPQETELKSFPLITILEIAGLVLILFVLFLFIEHARKATRRPPVK